MKEFKEEVFLLNRLELLRNSKNLKSIEVLFTLFPAYDDGAEQGLFATPKFIEVVFDENKSGSHTRKFKCLFTKYKSDIHPSLSRSIQVYWVNGIEIIIYKI